MGKTKPSLFLLVFFCAAASASGGDGGDGVIRPDPFFPISIYTISSLLWDHRISMIQIERMIHYIDFAGKIIEPGDADPDQEEYLVRRFEDGRFAGTDRIAVLRGEIQWHHKLIEISHNPGGTVTVSINNGVREDIYYRQSNVFVANRGRRSGNDDIGSVIVMEDNRYIYYDEHVHYRDNTPSRIIYFSGNETVAEFYNRTDHRLIRKDYYLDGLKMRSEIFAGDGEISYTDTYTASSGTGEITRTDSGGEASTFAALERRLDPQGFLVYQRRVYRQNGSGHEWFVIKRHRGPAGPLEEMILGLEPSRKLTPISDEDAAAAAFRDPPAPDAEELPAPPAVEAEVPEKSAEPVLAESPAAVVGAEAPKKSAGPLPIAALAGVAVIAALLIFAAGRRKKRR